eukprot:scaffold324213_cov82-Tisochrysis_lutea.AAC.1
MGLGLLEWREDINALYMQNGSLSLTTSTPEKGDLETRARRSSLVVPSHRIGSRSGPLYRINQGTNPQHQRKPCTTCLLQKGFGHL